MKIENKLNFFNWKSFRVDFNIITLSHSLLMKTSLMDESEEKISVGGKKVMNYYCMINVSLQLVIV